MEREEGVGRAREDSHGEGCSQAARARPGLCEALLELKNPYAAKQPDPLTVSPGDCAGEGGLSDQF